MLTNQVREIQPNKCGWCNATGHNQRTCPQKRNGGIHIIVSPPRNRLNTDVLNRLEEEQRMRTSMVDQYIHEQEQIDVFEREREREIERQRQLAYEIGRRRQLAYERERQRLLAHERLARQLARQQNSNENLPLKNIVENISALPVLRDTAIETDDCPVCLEKLGETGKTILKCGHVICISCMLQQTLIHAARQDWKKCCCPVCRNNYLLNVN